jgi:hypothetical protein
LALAKRCREEAHDDYAVAFHSKDAATRHYAMLALSAYGRDGLWDEVAKPVHTLGRPNVSAMDRYLRCAPITHEGPPPLTW